MGIRIPEKKEKGNYKDGVYTGAGEGRTEGGNDFCLYTSKSSHWTEMMILLLSVYCILKAKIFQWRQAVIVLFLGVVCLVSLFRNPRTADIIVTSIFEFICADTVTEDGTV